MKIVNKSFKIIKKLTDQRISQDEIAAHLNKSGITTPNGKRWTKQRVCYLARKNGLVRRMQSKDNHRNQRPSLKMISAILETKLSAAKKVEVLREILK